MNVSIITKAKEQYKNKINRQFISYYDSVLYLGEPKNEALDVIIDNLLNYQVHLKLDFNELSLINVKRYQDDEDEAYYFTSEYIEKHLTECVSNGFIDKNSPIYKLGFAKQSFIEMLECQGYPISDEELNNTQSPDIVFEDCYIEIEHNLFEMVCIERDGLREDLEKQQNLIDKLLAENDKLKTQLNEKYTCKPTENQGYLDPNNKFFSIEMKLCHDTWNYLYKDDNNSHLAHGKQVANYLENHADLTVNTKAINRIKTITNPKRTLASGDTDDDI